MEFIKNTEQSNVINIKNNIEIRKIINLHNSEGIKDLEQIKSMITTIKSGNHIISENIPNIKLLKNSDELILFDGHHSMLAYLYSNITSLHQIPHIIIENKNQPLTNKDINVFFGNHKEKLQNQDWRQFAINWQAPIEKQLSKRIHNNMGELFESIKENLS